MGAWDFGAFDNDDAMDWLADLEESPSALSRAFEVVAEIGDDYLESPDCCYALAAAEIVAALRGHPVADLPDNAEAWLDIHQDRDVSALVPVARAVVQRIRDNSELKERWDESDEAAKWYAAVDDTLARLNAT